ncbi:NAD-dependent epimerase/dehydratase family protein [Nocardia salmonicida]|uniref:NAD-dependent epimerase/dehydratase family protein n=1 Tax=Nocardia salmonicida TaxID=53431 RepID=UPI0007A49FF7|nr:NAD-dependent epimerase/dehydratase family protein [Nocardia salmonicida]
MTVLVLGGYGTVGAHLVRLLRAEGISVQAAGRDPARADRVVDLRDSAGVDAASADATIVVNCAGTEDVGLAPGLTTLLAVDALTARSGPVDIMIGLGSGESHGPAATA